MMGSIGRQPAIQTAATSEISNLPDATGLRRSAKLHRAFTRPAHPAHRRDGLQAAGLHTCSRPPLAGPGRCSAHCSPSSQSCRSARKGDWLLMVPTVGAVSGRAGTGRHAPVNSNAARFSAAPAMLSQRSHMSGPVGQWPPL